MAKSQPPVEGNVVQEFMIGNTKIKICDDYCKNTTPEQIQKKMERIWDIYAEDYRRKIALGLVEPQYQE